MNQVTVKINFMKEDFNWVRGIIVSCHNGWQLESCFALVKLFTQKYMYDKGMFEDRFSLLDAIKGKKNDFENRKAPITIVPIKDNTLHPDNHMGEIP